jgi:thiol-disulfide isomerase/thioredoxin
MTAYARPFLLIPCCFLGLILLFLSAGFFPSRANSAHTPFSQVSFPLVDAAGLSSMVASHKGAVVAVNIFASWCPPCREEVPDLIRVRNRFSAEDFVLIGVSVDKEPKALVSFLNRLKVNYPVALAGDDFIAEMRVTAVPRLLLYDRSCGLVLDHKGRVEEEELADAVSRLLAP